MKISDGYTAIINAHNLNHICNTKVLNKMSYIFIILIKLYYGLIGCHAVFYLFYLFLRGGREGVDE